MIRACWQSILEELAAMGSGRFVPYHKTALAVSAIVALLFSLIMRHACVFEAPVAVVDLDASKSSAELIEKINTSPFIEITAVYRTPIPADRLTEHDENIGVLYIPKEYEKTLLAGKRSVSIGYLADYSNSAQNAEVISALSEYIPELGAEIGAPRVASLGIGESAVKAAMSPVMLKTRQLFNPTNAATTSTTIGFVYFFSSLFYGLTVLMVPGRLRVMHRWEADVLHRTPLALLARGIPYAFFYTTAITLMTALLVVFGQLRFAGNYLTYLPSIFMTGLGFFWLGLLMAWNTQNPGEGASRMTFLVPPGFIMGGATMATGYLADWAYHASYAFPLVWQYRFWRDYAMRGTATSAMTATYGAYLLYLTVIAALVFALWEKERRKTLDTRAETPVVPA